MYDLGVDVQSLDSGKLADVLGQLGVEKPKITVADVEAIVKSAKISFKTIDWGAVEAGLA